MVSIRLLDDEYQQLKQLCVAKGARSISDLARDAMFRMLSRPTGENGTQHLADQVQKLDRAVERLGEKMEAIESRLPAARRAATWGK
jgi:plasmid stability protein